MNPSINDMLPPQAVAAMIRRNASPSMLFQQNPLAQNQLPGSAGYDPSLQQNPSLSPSAQPTPPVTASGQASGQPQLSEADMIIKALSDRLAHHSKITEKTINTLANQIDANQMVQNPPTA